MAFFCFQTPSGRSANATVSDSVFNTFTALTSSKADAGTTYVPPDGVRPFRTATPWCLELEGALRTWLTTNASDFTSGCAAIGVSSTLADFDLTKKSGPDNDAPRERVFITSAFPQVRGGGSGLHPAVFLRFLIATDYRSVQKTGSFGSDLASAMAGWS